MDSVQIDSLSSLWAARSDLQYEDVMEAIWAVVLSVYSASSEVTICKFKTTKSDTSATCNCRVYSTAYYLVQTGMSLEDVMRSKHVVANNYLPEHLLAATVCATVQQVVNQACLTIVCSATTSGTCYDSDSEFQGVDIQEKLRVCIELEPCSTKLCYPSKSPWTNHVRYIADTMNQLGMSLATSGIGACAINLLGALNRDSILETAHDTAPLSESVMADIMIQQAIERPDQIAIDSWDGMLTYAKLYHLASRLATTLVVQGVRLSDPVIICMSKSKWTIVAMFGIFLAGGICVPIDVDAPRRRWSMLKDRLAARIALTDHHADGLGGIGCRVIVLPISDNTEMSEVILPHVQAGSTAFIYFTSGSTGVPKGVLIQHGTLYTAVQNVAKAYALTEHSRTFQYAAYVFDVSMGDIFGTLSAGGCLCIPSEEGRINDIAAEITRFRASHVCLTSTVLSQIEPTEVTSLRYLFVGGEALNKADLPKWQPSVNFNSVYGTTETLIWDSIATYNQIERDASNLGISIGSWLWVINPESPQELRPVGAVGEILVEGPILAQGYLEDPQATAAKFINAPKWLAEFRKSDHIRCYRTGDLGFYNVDGTVSFVGRSDSQVKIRGQRIELGEIERNIMSVDQSFTQATVEVIAVGTREQEDTLVAFVNLPQDQELPPAHQYREPGSTVKTWLPLLELTDSIRGLFRDCHSKLASVLPKSMIPGLFVPIYDLPRTVSGKLDRKALRTWASSLNHTSLLQYRVLLNSPMRAPETLHERLLQEALISVLRVTQADISINGHFFQLGGDSVIAMQLVKYLRQAGKKLTVRQVFDSPRLLDLASRIEDITSVDRDVERPPEVPFALVASSVDTFGSVCDVARICEVSDVSMVEDIYPATPMQEALLAISARNNEAYWYRATFKLPESINISRFTWAWEILVAATPVLRTRLVLSQNQELLQVVIRAPIAWQTGLSIRDSAKIEMEEIELQGTELSRFILTNDVQNNENYFALDLHHAIYDGWSLALLFDQFVNIYQDGRFSRCVEPYTNFVRYLQDISIERAEDFWRKQFPRTVARFPSLPRNDYMADPRCLHSCRVKLQQQTGLSITPATIVQAAWGLVLLQQADVASEVVFGLTLSGRDIPVSGILDIAGPTITTVPIVLSILNKNQSVSDFLQGLQQQVSEMREHQHFGLSRIRQLSSHACWAAELQTLLVVQSNTDDDTHVRLQRDIGLELLDVKESDYLDYPLTIKCTIESGSLFMTIHFDEKIIHRDLIISMSQRFEYIVSLLMSTSDIILADVLIASPMELKQLQMWNTRPAVVYDTVHDLVAKQVSMSPDAVAMTGFDGTFSYREVWDLSTILTHSLYKANVGVGTYVVLCFSKSTRPILAMLAVLRCGGVCVSISPEDPDMRLESICRDIRATVVLCDTSQTHRFQSYVSHVLAVGSLLLAQPHAFQILEQTLQAPEVLPNHAAFIVHTSGSTGTPKGSILEHQSICTCLFAVREALQAGSHTKILQFCAFTFDMSILEIFVALTSGGSIHILSEHDRLNDLASTITRECVNTLILTPTVARLLSPKEVPSVTTLLVSGEPLKREDIAKWADEVKLLNGLGPSECCPLACITAPLTLESHPLDIGIPIGCNIWITDPDNVDCLQPIGCVGELIVEGPIVGRGYVNRAEETFKAFLTDFTGWQKSLGPKTESFRRIYRSGDLARYNRDGSIRFVGRADTQVKFHGQRIELSEIEYQLKSCQPDLGEVAAEIVNLRGHDSDQSLVAFVSLPKLLASKSEPQLLKDIDDDLQSWLHQALQKLSSRVPRYMVPSMLVPVTGMPLSMNGKLDRKCLRSWIIDFDRPQIDQYHQNIAIQGFEPRSANERLLQHVWAVLLRCDMQKITTEDQFLHLGGDSVLAMKMVAIMKEFGMSLTVEQIFRHPRLCQMARVLTELRSDKAATLANFALLQGRVKLDECIEQVAHACGMASCLIEDIYPATPMQEGLLAASAHRPGAYHQQIVFELSKSIDIDRFKLAWELFVSKQAVLRTRVVNMAGRLSSVQVVFNEQITWRTATSLKEYLHSDLQIPMTYGTELCRYALLEEVRDADQDIATCFVWSGHHAIYDGWSLQRTFQEVGQIYRGEKSVPTVPYKHFVQYLDQADVATMQSFWRDQFQGESDKFPVIPSGHDPTPNKIKNFALTLTRNLASSITTATLIQAAWAITNTRYSDNTDAIYGLTLAGRDTPVPDITDMIGPTFTTVPLRINVDPTQTLAEYLADVQDQVLQIKRFQHFGLQRIRHVSPEARWAASFHNLLVIHAEYSSATYDGLGLGTRIVNVEGGDLLDLALTVQCSVSPVGLELRVYFDEAVISEAQLDCVIYHFEHILTQLAQESDEITIHNLDIISQHDQQLLSTWTATDPTPFNATLHGLVEDRTKMQPDAIAVTGCGVNWTYKELEEMASSLAHELQSLICATLELRIALCFHKSSWPIVAILAILKCGGVCVSVSTEHPTDRILEICNDAEVKIMLCDPVSNVRFADHLHTLVPMQILKPDRMRSRIAQEIDVASDNAAFIVYSSGSTGKPKGSILTHRSIGTFLEHTSDTVYMNAAARTLQFSSYAFDGHIWEILGPLTRGGCVCVPSEEERMERLADTARKLQVNWSLLTPTVARLLSPRQIPSLKTLILSGESLSQQDVEKWADNLRLFNGLGPSECSILSTLTEPLMTSSLCSNIGRPTGCHIWLTDRNRCDRLVPIGCVGEMLVEGPIVGRGYVNRPQLNETSFISNPPWARTRGHSRRFYRSGDMVRYNSNGTLTFIGRKDTQVKIRGQRVELGEIDYHLQKANLSFGQTATEVLTVASRANSKHLAAFVQMRGCSDGAQMSGLLLRSTAAMRDRFRVTQKFLAGVLPRYMVPTMFIPVEHLPLNTSGKLDRKLLRTWASQCEAGDLEQYQLGHSAIVQPVRTTRERVLQELWAEVLHVPADSIGADNHFFQLGGDSVGAIELITVARGRGYQLKIIDVFQTPDLQRMALTMTQTTVTPNKKFVEPFALIDAAHIDILVAAAAKICGITSDCIEDMYPVAPMQEALLAVSALRSGTYRSRMIFKLPQSLDLARFQAAWQKLFEKHAIFRTRIVDLDEVGLVQVVLKRESNLHLHESSTLARQIEQDEELTFDLGTAMISASVIVVPHQETRYFVWNAHHAVYDGWSLPMAFEEVSKIYQGENIRSSTPFNSFIAHVNSQDKDAARDFWTSQFLSVSDTFPELPSMDYIPEPSRKFEATIPVQRADDFAFTSANLIQAAWALTVARQTQRDCATFGLTLSGRDIALDGIETVLGPTITTIPVRVDLGALLTVRALLQQVKDQVNDTRPYQHTGLQSIRQLSPAARSAVDFQNLLVIQLANEGDLESALSSLHIQQLEESDRARVAHALTIQCKASHNFIHVLFSYDDLVISSLRLESIYHQFSHAISQLVNSAGDVLLDDLSRMSKNDMSLTELWAGELPQATENVVHDVVTRQCVSTPDAIAVTGHGGQFTYEALSTAADRLVNLFSQLNVNLEDRVALCMDRSTLSIPVMLAILRTGATCVPLSADITQDRAEAILQTTEASILVADAANALRFSSRVRHVVDVNTVFAQTDHVPTTLDLVKVRPSNAAFILHTSGTTGTPKAIVLEHRSFCMSMLAHGRTVGIDSTTRTLQFSAYTFDCFLNDVFATLFCGGCVCVPSETQRSNDLEGAIRCLNVNLAFLTPTVADLLLPSAVPSLKTLVLVGEIIRLQTFRSWRPYVRVINSWGPAECSIAATTNLALTDDDLNNIGRPLACRVWITIEGNPDFLAPAGCVGELLIEGPTLARHYLKAAKATNDAFIVNPAWSRGKTDVERRFYRTRDLARFDHDGAIRFVGRADKEVKIHGQRVDLGYIETHLRNSITEVTAQKDAIYTVVVDFLRFRGDAESSVVAFMTISEKTAQKETHLITELKPTCQELRRLLAKKMSVHLIPRAIVLITDIPKTSSGKLHRTRLCEIAATVSPGNFLDMHARKRARHEPLSDKEALLQESWASILRIDRSSISTDDDFLQIGGDSVRAMQLASSMRHQGWNLTVKDIFHRPKLSDLAQALVYDTENLGRAIPPFSLLKSQFLSQEQAIVQVARMCNVNDHAVEDIFPCTALQQGLLSITAKRSAQYIAQNVWEFNTATCIERFRDAWTKLVEVNQILRTRIVDLEHQGLVQVVLKESPEWRLGSSLDEYLRSCQDMGLGTPLSTVAIVEKPDQGRYWFVWRIHHALYDGWSMSLLMKQLLQLYNCMASSAPASFQSFVKSVTLDFDHKAAECFWLQRLQESEAQVFPVLPAPTYQPTAEQTFQCRVRDISWPKTGITPTSVLRAAWAMLAASHTGINDVIFGEVSSGRQLAVPGIDTMTGPTIATIPVRVKIDPASSLHDLQRTVQDQSVQAVLYEQIGLQRIRKIEREIENNCLFQTLLVVQPSSTDQSVSDLPQIFTPESMSSDDNVHAFTTYALTIVCNLRPDGFDLYLSFDPHISRATWIERLANQFVNLVRASCCNEARLLRDMTIVTDADLEDIWSWNASVPHCVQRPVHSIIARTMRQFPNRPALYGYLAQDYPQEFTYQQLDSVTNALAHHLIEQGLQTGACVLLCFDKSLMMPITMLAVMKAGGTSIALDPAQPEDRLKLIFDQVGPGLVLSSDSHEALCQRLVTIQTVIKISEVVFSHGRSTQVNLPEVDASEALYIVFTSGSTGTPKGAVITHQNFSSAIYHQQKAMGLTEESRVYDFASYSFDAAWWNLLHTLAAGACLCVPTENDRKNNIVASMNAMKVTFTQLTPTVARLIEPSTVSSLQILILAGETVMADDVARWSPYVKIKNFYGPAECSVAATALDISSRGFSEGGIGGGIGLNTWVVDMLQSDRLAPIGSVGELWLEGPLVGLGYLPHTQVSNNAFVDNPAWLTSGSSKIKGRTGRLYRTGDIVQYNPDGTLKFIGRKDAQVKLHGQRIELTEVEYHVRQALEEPCNDVAAEIVHLKHRNPMLVVFTSQWVEFEAETVSARRQRIGHIRDRLSRLLPSYMIPSAFVPLDHIPTTSTGKVNRARLRELGSAMTPSELLEYSSYGQESLYEEPETFQQYQLRDLWASVLGISSGKIGRYDSFLKLGGDSVDVMRLVAEVRKSKMMLAVSSVFARPQLHEMARSLMHSTSIEERETVPFSTVGEIGDRNSIRYQAASHCDIPEAQIEDIVSCTPHQEGLMAITLRRPMDFISRSVYVLDDGIDIDRFKAAWTAAVARIDVLRTRIVQLPKMSLVQVILKDDFHWFESDCLNSYLTYDQQKLMGLGTHLVRFAICRSKESMQSQFVWTIHHSIFDHFSSQLILQQVERAYCNLDLGEVRPFKSFVKHITELDTRVTRMFWEQELADLDAVCFPQLPSLDYEPQATHTLAYSVEHLHWPTTNFTSATIVRAAWSLLIAHHTATKDVIFGVTNIGRRAAVTGIEQVIGPTTAASLFRVMLDFEDTIEDFLQLIQHKDVMMAEHEHFGLPAIRNSCTNGKKSCQFSSMLLIKPKEDKSRDISPGRMIFHEIEQDIIGTDDLNNFNTYALMVVCDLRTDGIDLHVGHDESILTTDQAKLICSQLECIIQEICMADMKAVKVRDLSPTSREDLSQLWKWNATVPKPEQRCVHEHIFRHVTERPDHLAVYAWDGHLTYLQLDQVSTNLAHRLSEAGVGPETQVPLYLEKSVLVPIAIIAVMKAGGTFALLDTALPSERLRSIICQLDGPVIITSVNGEEQCNDITSGSKACILANKEICDDEPEQTILPVIDSDHALYIMFTSGTTGIPKGVVITHSQYATGAKTRESLGYRPGLRVFDYASYSYDVSVDNNLITLMTGGCLCIPSDHERHSSLADVMQRMQIQFAHVTPSVAKLLVHYPLPSLEFLAYGGEKVTTSDLEPWRGRVHLILYYGPAECSVICTVNQRPFDCQNPANIGHRSASATWIVNPYDHTKLSPIGAIGELVIEGPLVGRGYLNDADRTAASFIQDPLWLTAGMNGEHPGRSGRLYKTGDLVKYAADGSLIFISRKDLQAKIRGQRLELAEVEAHILEHLPTGGEVATEVVTPIQSSTMLVAFISLMSTAYQHLPKRTSQALTEGPFEQQAVQDFRNLAHQLSSILVERLPQYMVPSVFIPLEEMPIANSGKLDRKRLRQIGAALSPQELTSLISKPEANSLPMTKQETQMRQIWATVLCMEMTSITKNDNFFFIGGDSILAMRLVGQARESGVLLTVSDVFHHPRLSEMAEIAVQGEDSYQDPTPFTLLPSTCDVRTALDEAITQIQCIARENVADVYPVTDFQAECISSALTIPLGQCYHFFIDMPTNTRVRDVEQACLKLWNHFDILRTIFIRIHNQYMQVVLHHIEPNITLHSTQGQEDLHKFCRELFLSDADSVLTLGTPLNRIFIIRSPVGQLRLAFRLSHAQYDGISLHVMLSSLALIFHGEQLPPSPKFSGYIRQIQRQTEAGRTYWRNLLNESQVTYLESSRCIAERAHTTMDVDAGICITRVVTAPVNRENATQAAMFAACCAFTLAKNNKDAADVVFGQVVSGRSGLPAVLQDVTGACNSTVPVRVRFQLQQQSRLEEALEIIQLQRIQASPFETHQFSDIVRHCTTWPEDTRELGLSIQFQNVEESPMTAFDGVDSRLTVFNDKRIATTKNVFVFAQPALGNWKIDVLASARYYTATTIESFAEHLFNTIATLTVPVSH